LNQSEYAVVVAGGKGTRMKSNVPKQFIEINGLPIIVHTLNAFFRYSEKIKIVLVLPAGDFDAWHSIVDRYQYNRPILLQAGGDTRFQSVKKGLQKIGNEGLVAIHDGVRPLVSEDMIRASFRLAAIHQTAVAAVPLKESIRISENDQTRAVDRSHFRLIQTPQTFQVDLIKRAYETNEDESLTDDASVAERAGHRIKLFDGSYRNIKITTEEDLLIASALMTGKQQL
jgi:2-C-methyl-D-erythritol 4-phosphate cytidylyltransferase